MEHLMKVVHQDWKPSVCNKKLREWGIFTNDFRVVRAI